MVEERVDGLHVVGDLAEEGRLRHVLPHLARHYLRLLLYLLLLLAPSFALLLWLFAELGVQADDLARQSGFDWTWIRVLDLGADGGLLDAGLPLALHFLVLVTLLSQNCQIGSQLNLQAVQVLLESAN